MDARAQEVLDFWFGPPARSRDDVMVKIVRWFSGGPDMDGEVRDRFGDLVDAALRGDLDAWAASSRERLALVILLDQFTRNLFRGDPKTHDGDAKAQQLALDAFDRGLDRELSFVERTFLSMPLLHAEDVALQERVGEIARGLDAECPAEYAQMHAMHLEQCGKYLGLIGRFGRFPHRNALLGRASTPAEDDFLRDWAEHAPPAGMPKA